MRYGILKATAFVLERANRRAAEQTGRKRKNEVDDNNNSENEKGEQNLGQVHVLSGSSHRVLFFDRTQCATKRRKTCKTESIL